jgi:hypothetical protein
MNKVQTQRGINYSEKNFVFLICFSFIFIFSLSFSLANPFGFYDETKPQINPEESFGTTDINNTYNNNTYINVTATVNSTQFSNDNPITINISWLTSFIQSIINTYNFITGTDVPNYEEDPVFTAVNSSLARTGICPEGYVVQNTSNSGVECVSVSILANTSIYSGDNYTYITGQDTVNVNISEFDLRYYNKTEISTLYVPYSGATGNVDLGTYKITSTNLVTKNRIDTKYLSLSNDPTNPIGSYFFLEPTGLWLSLYTGFWAKPYVFENPTDNTIWYLATEAPVREGAGYGVYKLGPGMFESEQWTVVGGRLSINNGPDVIDQLGGYTFPLFDGTSGQALVTNGSGEVSWQTVSSDLTPYAKLDGTNQPFTGDISAPNISFNQTNSFVNTQIGMCFNGTDYIFGNYTGVAGC